MVVKGDRAVGWVNGKPMVELTGLGGAAPGRGQTGLHARGMQVQWDSFEVQTLGLPPVNPPEGAEVQVGSGQVEFARCGIKPAVIQGFRASNARVTVQATPREEAGGLGIAQLALHGRMNEAGENVYMTVDLPPRKGLPCRVSLLGKVNIKGRLQSGTYQRTGGPQLWYGNAVTLALQMRNGTVNGFINGKRIVSARHRNNTPVPQAAGDWGFRMTSLQGAVTSIQITD
jgi:hypothetical protein